MADINLQNKIDAFLGKAYKNFMVKDYNTAIRELKSAEVLDSSNPEILYNLGVNYCRLGLFSTAAGHLMKMLKLSYSFIDALEVKKLLAYALINTKEYKKARSFIDEVLELVPADITALNLKGYCLEMLGKHGLALETYRTVIGIEKGNYNAHNSISYIIARFGNDLREALNHAQIAFNSNPANPAYLDTLGFIYLKMRDFEKAEKFLTSAFEKSPLSLEINEHFQELKKLKNA